MENTNTPRRDFLKKSVALSAGLTLTNTMLQSFTTEAAVPPGSPMAANEKDFRMGVIGPAELSLATSQIAVNKATNKNAKEVAGFELTEAIAVTGVLKDLHNN